MEEVIAKWGNLPGVSAPRTFRSLLLQQPQVSSSSFPAFPFCLFLDFFFFATLKLLSPDGGLKLRRRPSLSTIRMSVYTVLQSLEHTFIQLQSLWCKQPHQPSGTALFPQSANPRAGLGSVQPIRFVKLFPPESSTLSALRQQHCTKALHRCIAASLHRCTTAPLHLFQAFSCFCFQTAAALHSSASLSACTPLPLPDRRRPALHGLRDLVPSPFPSN